MSSTYFKDILEHKHVYDLYLSQRVNLRSLIWKMPRHFFYLMFKNSMTTISAIFMLFTKSNKLKILSHIFTHEARFECITSHVGQTILNGVGSLPSGVRSAKYIE